MRGSTMAAQLSQEEMELLKVKVFQAAQEGGADDIRSALSSLSPDLVKEVLHHRTHRQGQGHLQPWEDTPLSTAAQLGHLEVVQLLVDDFNIDLDQRVTSEPFVKDFTALMYASYEGYLDIVKLLVTKGCAVNLANERNETALYLACLANHLEVVKYLVRNGAKINEDEHDNDKKDGFTCLMAASHEGSEKVVKFLLKKGANVNKETDKGVTALHMAAYANAVKVVKILLKNGAMMSTNSEGRSPLMEAAWMCSRGVVNFFAKSSYVSRKEKVDSLELLGANMVIENTTAGLRYLRQAMVMRHEDPREVLPKPLSVLPAPGNFEESRTLEELEARGLDPDQLRLECLAIARRILGPRSISFAGYCLEYALALYEGDRLDEALTVLIQGLQVREGFETTEGGHFPLALRCVANILCAMMSNDQEPKSSSVCEILEPSLEILQQNQPASQRHFHYLQDFAGMCLLCICVGLEVAKSPEEMARLQKLAKSLIHLQPSPFRGGSVLHAAVSTSWDNVRYNFLVQDLHVDSLVSFLLRCNADVNAVDDTRNRPLHILAKCPEGYFDAETLGSLTQSLVEAGAPARVLNGEGETPLDIAVTEEMDSVLHEFYPVSLLSLAATAVVKHGIPYAGQVPEIVEEFLRRH